MSNAIKQIKAEVREKANKGATKELRNTGKVPAIIYGQGKAEQMITIEGRDLLVTYRKGRFFSQCFEIDLGKEKTKVIPKDIQFNPVTDEALHVDFQRVSEDSEVKISVPVNFVGKEKSPGLKRGGVLNAVRRTVEVYCAIAHIPEALIGDISQLKIRDSLKFSDLQVPENVKPAITDRDFTIATIAGRVTEDKSETSVEGDASEEDGSEGGDSSE